MTIVHASWVKGFATRLMQLRPGKSPLDAVRDATTTFADSAHLPPEQAAELFTQSPHEPPHEPPAASTSQAQDERA